MNNANTFDDRQAAGTGLRLRAAAREPSSLRRPEFRDSSRREPVAFRRSRFLAGVLLALAFSPVAACSGTPERQVYEIADRRAEWLDRFILDRQACAAAGGVIVQERYRPASIRVGGSGPEVGTRYYCRY